MNSGNFDALMNLGTIFHIEVSTSEDWEKEIFLFVDYQNTVVVNRFLSITLQ